MKSLADRKSRLAFITEDTVRYRGSLRRIVVEVSRDGYTAEVRLEGTRTRYPFSFGGIFNHAVKSAVERQRAEKRAARKGKR